MNATTDISDLIVMHWPKSPGARAQTEAGNRPGLLLDTCLRQLSIGLRPASARHDGAEIRTGVDAYRFVLEVTTGLRSAVPGETNVFGQFKHAWLTFRRDRQTAEVARLAPLIHRVINDTKAIRAEHLQGIGGSSYGSLVRRLIAPGRTDRILFVGAGNLAQSMLPLFRNYEVGIWNRRAVEIPTSPVGLYFGPGHGSRAARWANHVILTTPPDPINDASWRTWVAAGHVRTVVHLGHRRDEGATGSFGAQALGLRAFDLDDVFALRRAQASMRSRQLACARVACRQRAGQCARHRAVDDREPKFARLSAA